MSALSTPNFAGRPLNNSSTVRKVAVVGGGITGLAAAHRLGELSAQSSASGTLQVTLFDPAPRLGGVFGSERIGDELIERGADSFITNKPGGVDLCQRLGIADQLIGTDPRFRRSLILCNGRPVETPPGFQLLAPSTYRSIWRTPLLSWRGKLRLALEPWIARGGGEEESVADFVRRRMGQEVLERIAQPLVGGIYTSNPEQLSLQATLPRFLEMERRDGSVMKALRRQRRDKPTVANGENESGDSGARYSLFVTPRDGMQFLIDSLERRIAQQGTVRRQQMVTSLSRGPNDWQVTLRAASSEDSAERFDAVLCALPVHAAARILSVGAPQCSSALQAIESASSAIVVTGHALADFQHPLDAFGLVIPHREGRRILATSFLSRKFPDRAAPGNIILRTFVGGALQPEELNHSDDKIVMMVLDELRELLGFSGEPHFTRVCRYPLGMPQYLLGHQARIAAVRECAAVLPGFQLAGNYFDGVGIPDCIQCGERAAEAIFSQPIKSASG